MNIIDEKELLRQLKSLYNILKNEQKAEINRLENRISILEEKLTKAEEISNKLAKLENTKQEIASIIDRSKIELDKYHAILTKINIQTKLKDLPSKFESEAIKELENNLLPFGKSKEALTERIRERRIELLELETSKIKNPV